MKARGITVKSVDMGSRLAWVDLEGFERQLLLFRGTTGEPNPTADVAESAPQPSPRRSVALFTRRTPSANAAVRIEHRNSS